MLSFGCSTISARTSEGEAVFGRNFDWGICTALFASTEWSTVYNQSTGEARYYHRENYQKYYSFIAGSP